PAKLRLHPHLLRSPLSPVPFPPISGERGAFPGTLRRTAELLFGLCDCPLLGLERCTSRRPARRKPDDEGAHREASTSAPLPAGRLGQDPPSPRNRGKGAGGIGGIAERRRAKPCRPCARSGPAARRSAPRRGLLGTRVAARRVLSAECPAR